MHIVSEGDSIWSISRKYNISVDDIIEMNNLDPKKFLQLGQQLSIGNKNIYRNIDSKKEQSSIVSSKETAFIKSLIYLM